MCTSKLSRHRPLRWKFAISIVAAGQSTYLNYTALKFCYESPLRNCYGSLKNWHLCVAVIMELENPIENYHSTIGLGPVRVKSTAEKVEVEKYAKPRGQQSCH